jgi:drug/metabolite transporter (DMT)-like permease
VVHGVHTVLALAYIAVGATLSFALLTLASGQFTPALGFAGWGWIVAMGVISTVVAAGTFLAGLRRLGPARAATTSTVEPLITVVIAAFALGEHLLPVQLAGGIVILVGVVIVIRERSEHHDSV